MPNNNPSFDTIFSKNPQDENEALVKAAAKAKDSQAEEAGKKYDFWKQDPDNENTDLYEDPYQDLYSDDGESEDEDDNNQDNLNNNPEDEEEAEKADPQEEPELGENLDTPSEDLAGTAEAGEISEAAGLSKRAAGIETAARAKATTMAGASAKQTAERAVIKNVVVKNPYVWIAIGIIALILFIFFFTIIAYNQQGSAKDNPPPGPADGNKIVQVALGEVGTCEEPLGSDKGTALQKYFDAGGGQQGQQWCAAFVSWVYQTAGYSVPRTMGAIATIQDGSFSTFAVGAAEMNPGDIIIRTTGGGHVGIVESYTSGTLKVIEGNTGSYCVRENVYYNVGNNWTDFGRLK